LVLSARLHW